MNARENHLSNADREMLDQLVDGELADPERRELLSRLERIEGGWRACALNFLQTQCLQEAFGKLPEELASPRHEPKLSVVRRLETDRWRRRLKTAVTLAATFLIALGVGWRVGTFRERLGQNDLLAAKTSHPASGKGQPSMVASLGGGSGSRSGISGVESVSDQSILFPDAAAFPLEFQAALERAGYRVKQSRELLPIPIEGGRQAVVPVDQLDVHYVGNHVE